MTMVRMFGTPEQLDRMQQLLNEIEITAIRNEVKAGRMDRWEGWRLLFNMGYRGVELARAAGLK